MQNLLWTLGGLVLGIVALYTGLYWAARRRGTPEWTLDSDTVPPVSDLMATLSGLTNSRIYGGNAVEIYTNGDLFEPMFRDIDSARHTVHFETFVWWAGDVERRMADALIAAARRDVRVRMTVDGVGCNRRSPGIFDELRDGGVELQIFSPLKLVSLHRFNERTHRKLLIVDGRIGYTMGHGISDHWLGDAQDESHYRDTGVRLRGPVVHGLQSVFAAGWAAETNELLCGETIFPRQERSGDVDMCVVSSVAGEDYSNVALAFTLAIAAARQEILIQNPYFAPDRNVVRLLCEAVERGVSVTLMLPGNANDSNLVRLAAQHLYPELLNAGVRILEYKPTLSHQKVMIVDRYFARVGSTNLDCRSLELNAEAGVTIVDTEVANTLRAHFHRDATRCEEITLEDVRQRSWLGRVQSAGAYLFHGQL